MTQRVVLAHQIGCIFAITLREVVTRLGWEGTEDKVVVQLEACGLPLVL